MPEPDRYKWYVVAMLWGIVFFNYADRQALSAVLPLLRGEMHLSPVQEGLLGSAFAWTYGLCSPLAGAIVDRIRRRTAVLAGLNIWSAICAVTAFGPGFNSLLALRAAEGLGETAYFPASVSLISEHHDQRTRSRALGLHQTGVYIGTVGGTTVAAMIALRFGWRSSFLIFGTLGLLLGLVLHFFLREPERREREGTAQGSLPEALKTIVTTPTALALLLAFICANAVAAVLLFWMPTYVHDHFHQNLTFAGFTASFFAQFGSIAGAIAGGYGADLARRRTPRGRILTQMIGLALGAPFVILAGASQSLTIVIAAFFGWGFFKGMYDANIFASMFEVTRPAIRGSVVGIMNLAAWLLGAGSAPVIIGYIAERASLGYAISSAAMVYLAGSMLLAVAAIKQPQMNP
ncbi:MAG TPA: MFS transporter [Thermoanaerobaculia bacterium]|nr:MFS transporter [Thermoanaerobaculia bacterium]